MKAYGVLFEIWSGIIFIWDDYTFFERGFALCSVSVPFQYAKTCQPHTKYLTPPFDKICVECSVSTVNVILSKDEFTK